MRPSPARQLYRVISRGWWRVRKSALKFACAEWPMKTLFRIQSGLVVVFSSDSDNIDNIDCCLAPDSTIAELLFVKCFGRMRAISLYGPTQPTVHLSIPVLSISPQHQQPHPTRTAPPAPWRSDGVGWPSQDARRSVRRLVGPKFAQHCIVSYR